MGHSIADTVARLFRRSELVARSYSPRARAPGLPLLSMRRSPARFLFWRSCSGASIFRTATAALGASAGAIAVARVLLGVEPDFVVPNQPFPGFATVPVHVVLGFIAGLAGAAYTRAIMGSLAVADQARGFPVAARAALIGGLVGLLAWCAPQLVGGGDAITQRTLMNADGLSTIALIFAVRFALGSANSSTAASVADCLAIRGSAG
jgi:chloride channel protein, CIC family